MVLFFGIENTNRTFLLTFKGLNMLDSTLFVVCLFVIMLFVLFWGILTLNYISCKCLVAVYTVNTPSTPYCWFLTAENVLSIFDAMIWTSKHQPYHFCIFQTSKYVRRDLVCSLFTSKCVFSILISGILTSKYINYSYLLAV